MKIIITIILLISSNLSLAVTEDWYFNASIGIANKSNPDDVEQELSSYENLYAENRVTAVLDIGVYWPVIDDTYALGLVSNATIDSVQSGVANEVIAHDLQYIGLSVLKFLDGVVDKGVFVRADIGSAKAKYRYDTNSYQINDGSGSATLLGVGYSRPISSGWTRMIFSLNTIFSTIDDRDFNSTQFTIGFMW